jgi:hypothetical protein
MGILLRSNNALGYNPTDLFHLTRQPTSFRLQTSAPTNIMDATTTTTITNHHADNLIHTCCISLTLPISSE